MLFFFYGPDSFRVKRKVDAIIAGYKAKHKSGMNFRYFDFSQTGELDELKNFLGAFSMFQEKKLAVVENIFEADEDILAGFAEYLKKEGVFKTAESFLVVPQLLELNNDKKKKQKYSIKEGGAKNLFSLLTSKESQSEEFEFISGAKLEQWIKKEVERIGGKIELLAARKLIEFAGADLWRLQNEIGKLAAYKNGEAITEGDIEEMVESKIETDIFKMIDALAARNKILAFKHLHRHLARGESEIYILTMLAYQFRNLILVKSEVEKGSQFGALAKKIKMHPFVLRKTFDQSKNFSFAALENIYEKLMETDIAVKSGRLESQAALDLLVAEIAG